DAIERLGMPAVAVTDLGNVSAMIKFYKAAIGRGIKPIIGADVWTAPSRDGADPHRMTLLCLSGDGFKHFSRLLTTVLAEAQSHGRALLLDEWLTQAALDGLIALSGAQHGALGKALTSGGDDAARAVLDRWRTRMPGRFYIECQRLGRPGEVEYVERAVRLAAAEGVPVVATNDVCFIEPADFDAHEVRICISRGHTLDDASRPREYTEEQYLKGPGAMRELFADLPEALDNTIEIAKRCNLEVRMGEFFLPAFETPDGTSTADHLRRVAAARLAARLDAAGRSDADGVYAQ